MKLGILQLRNRRGAQLAGKAPAFRTNTRIFLNALPADLARKIASENATVIYKLRSN
jgi:hypothetical protein